MLQASLIAGVLMKVLQERAQLWKGVDLAMLSTRVSVHDQGHFLARSEARLRQVFINGLLAGLNRSYEVCFVFQVTSHTTNFFEQACGCVIEPTNILMMRLLYSILTPGRVFLAFKDSSILAFGPDSDWN